MNINLIAGLLLASIALTGHAGEPDATVERASNHVQTGNAGDVASPRAHFGTKLTDAVMVDVSSRIAQDLAAQMARELKAQEVPAADIDDKLLVSTH